MTFGSIINTLFIGPLKLVFEILFSLAYSVTENVGLSIVMLSLAINVLVLPLYRCADAMQEKAQKREAELHDGIVHIKKTFSGNEKMMMLETFYKQNHYSPFSALSGAVSLLLEIPFFIAAYQFLSNAVYLEGTSLGPILNLASPDALIKIGSFKINVLPFLMTVINIIASVIFLKGAPLKSKIQLYAMAIVFLVLLYDSPSGLVFYWTLNNVFSLVKNILYKLKNPKRIVAYICSAGGVVFFGVAMIFFNFNQLFIIVSSVVMVLLQLPLAWYYLKSKIKFNKKEVEYTPNKKVFFIAVLFLAILTGLFIPSVFIADNPSEFVDMMSYLHPNWYLASAFCLSGGTFIVWCSVFYWLAPPKGRVYFERTMIILSVVMAINYFCFGRNLGTISSSLIYDNVMWFSVLEYVINGIVTVAVIVGLLFLVRKFKKITSVVMAIATFAIGVTSVVNFVIISDGTPSYDASAVTEMDASSYDLELVQEGHGQNVIFIMLDRGLGATFPFIVREMYMREYYGEALEVAKDDFLSGFTYYSNVVSFGNHTNFGAPAFLGGYEYTPMEINLRADDSMAKKLNEANLTLPRIFTEKWANKASVFDPVFTNNSWISDLSVYEDKEYNPDGKITAENTIGTILDDNQRKATVKNRKRDFYVFSLMKSMPLPLQLLIYDEGEYNSVGTVSEKYVYSTQVTYNNNLSKASGVSRTFMENYNIITALADMTKVKNEGNKFVFLRNDVTHEPMILHEETYEPIIYETDADGNEVQIMTFDNTEYDKKYADRFDPITVNGVTYSINIETAKQMAHYQTNVMALLELEKWFDYLKANNMYDNSRIIVASDHGYYLDMVDELSCEGLGSKDKSSVESYFPLLLFKDFNQTGTVKYDGTFKTNADVPYMLTSGIQDVNPVNPFTGKALTTYDGGDLYLIRSRSWNPRDSKNVFVSPNWTKINGGDTLWDSKAWELLNNKKAVNAYKLNK